MLYTFRFFIKYFLFWWLYFVLTKILFLIYHYTQATSLSLVAIGKIFIYGSRLDWSFSAYLSVIPWLVFALSTSLPPLIRPSLKRWLISLYTILMVLLCSFVVIIDVELFRKWGFRIDATPLMYLSHLKEVWASASSSPLLLLVWLWGMLSLTGVLLYFWLLHNRRPRPVKQTVWYALPIYLWAIALLIIPIRGGLQLAPINQSSVYFSTQRFANLAAINPVWNFFDSCVNHTAQHDNPYQYFAPKQAKALVDSLFLDTSTQTHFVIDTSVQRPNVIIITWESLTAKVFDKTGGTRGVLPQLSRLAQEGILFSRCYASGDRSDKGLVALLSAFPAQPTTSIMTIPQKTIRLPFLSQVFRQQHYTTAWYYGGEPEFANMKSYMLNGQFQKLVTKYDFAPKDMNAKWGAHDHVVLGRLLKDCAKMPNPFFVNLFTLSSHEPFEVPMKTFFKGTDEKSLFINAHHYTDASLGAFIQKAKEQSWWKNTLIIIVADHGHPLPEEASKQEDYHIPMVWTGGLLKEKGLIIKQVCSQNDIAATLLAQLKLPRQAFYWSKNIFGNQYKPFAFFTFNDGFGLVQDRRSYCFDNAGKHLIESTGKIREKDFNAGKALQQQAFQDFLNK